MKQLFIVSVIAILATPYSASAEPITLLNADDFVWETTPEGVAFSALQGDRFSESYQALVKLPAGTVSPPHVKSANMYGVMLQGEMVHYANGETAENAKTIGPGAFYRISSGLAHISACISVEPCIAYLYQDGAFDFLPVQQ